MILRRNDRVVFLGDSITEQQLYTNYVESYLAGRYPDLNLTFFNAGWGGDTAPGGLARLERDVWALKPTVVTVCYGMNDAGYTRPTAEILGRFAAGMEGLVRAFKARGLRVVLLTPGFADVEANPNLAAADYNRRGLRVLADQVLKLARRERLPVFDIHRLMTEVDARGKRKDRAFNMAPDGFHPSPPGHLVMAYGLLKALGVPERHHAIVLDARTGRASAPNGARVRGRREDDGSYTLEAEFPDLPFHVEAEARKVLDHLPFQGAFNGYTLRVRGLKPGAYYLRLGQERSPGFGAAELRRGLDLSGFALIPPFSAARALHDFTREKCQAYFKAWRLLALMGGPRETPLYFAPAHKAAIRAMPAWDRTRARAARAGLKPFKLRVVPADSRGERIGNGEFIGLWALSDSPRAKPGPLISPHPPFPPKGGRSPGWTKHYLSPARAANNLGEIFGPRQEGSAWAAVTLESPVDQEADLLIGSDDGFAVHLNGRVLASCLDLRRGWAPDQDRVPVRLKAGSNALVIQVSQYGGNWGFSARFRGLKREVLARN